jgi:spermidine synthase
MTRELEVIVPDGICGDFSVETYTVSEQDSRFSTFNRGDYVPAGTYKRLMRGNTVVMSNTLMEVQTNMDFIRQAHGRVLINGLGLGMILNAILKKEVVTEVYVIEKYSEVITLVGPSFCWDQRVKIIQADALEYKPPKGIKFDCVYHDIWDYICSDNLVEMGKLHRKYGKLTKWQDSWQKELCKYYKRREKREEARYNYFFS